MSIYNKKASWVILFSLFVCETLVAQIKTDHIIDLRTKPYFGKAHNWDFKPGDSPYLGQGEAGQFSRAMENLPEKEKDGWIKNFPVQLAYTRYKDSNYNEPFSDFNEYFKKFKGYAWYRTQFIIKKDDFKNVFKSDHIMLRLGKIGQADAVYLNGVFIGSTGLEEFTPPDEILSDEKLAYDKIRIYKIPRDILRFDRSNVIAVRTFSRYYIAPGLSHDRFYIGSDKLIERSVFWDDFKKIFVISLTLLLGIFYLYWQFLFRQEERATFYFALGSLAISANTLMKSQIAYSIFNNAFWIKKLEYITFIALVHLILDFIVKFSRVKNSFIRYTSHFWHLLAATAIVAVLLISDLQSARRFMFGWGILPVILMGNILYLMIKGRKTPAMGTVAFGVFGMVILLMNDVLVGFQFSWVTWEASMQDYAFAFFSFSVAASIVSNMIKSRDLIEKQKKEKERLSRYFSPDVMQTIINEEIEMGGVEKPIATLFADIAGFTAFSEKNEPAVVVEKLNLMFEKLSGVIFEHKATLDKYIGDCIMAFWGAPKTTSDDAYQAISCAIHMQKTMKLLKEKMGETEMPFNLRIGVNYGPSIVGNIGSKLRMDYTVIGDAVNTASRIESNGIAGKVAVSESTFLAAGGEKYCTFSEIKEVTVKGKKEPVKIYIIEDVIPKK